MAKIPIDVDVKDEKATQSIKSFGGSLGGAIKGIKAMTRAAIAFIATPFGAVVTALALAIGALTSFFKRSEEGQNALNKVTRIFSSILDNVLDVVDKVGKAIFEFVSNPLEGIEKLGNNILKFIKNPLQGTIEIFTKLAEGAKEFGKEVANDVEEAKKLADIEASLDLQEREFLVSRAKRQAEISKLRLKARQEEEFSARQREQFLKDAQILTEQQLDAELAIQRQREDALLRSEKLANSDKETLDELAEAQAEIFRIEEKRFTDLKALEREFKLVRTQIRKEEADEIKAIQKEQAELDVARIETDKARLEGIQINADQVVASIDKIIQAEEKRQKVEEGFFRTRQRLNEAERLAKIDTVVAVSDALAFGADALGKTTLAGIALGVATATADTFIGANKALSQGTPAGFVQAGLIIAIGLRNVARIIKAGQQAGLAVSAGASVSASIASNNDVVQRGRAGQNQPNVTASVSVEEINRVGDKIHTKVVESSI